MNRYLSMPIGRTQVILCYSRDAAELLCVYRKSSQRKVKLNRAWWRRAETYLQNALRPAIEAKP